MVLPTLHEGDVTSPSRGEQRSVLADSLLDDSTRGTPKAASGGS